MGITPPAVADEVRLFIEQHRIARVGADRTVLVDLLNPNEDLQWCVMPPALRGEEFTNTGLEYIRSTRPRIVVLLTRHSSGEDFHRLRRLAGSYLTDAPVSGVEAHIASWPDMNHVAPPEPHESNKWLRAFQKEQFPWHEREGKLMLPSEAIFCSEFMVRYNEIDGLFDDVRANEDGKYSEEIRNSLRRLLYLSIFVYRCWGIAGQFGWWLQHPVVQKRLEGTAGYIPLTLGSGHVYETQILRSCGADVIVLNVDSEPDPEGPERVLYRELFERQVLVGYALHTDLARPLPF